MEVINFDAKIKSFNMIKDIEEIKPKEIKLSDDSVLIGKRYKIKPMLADHAIYVLIFDAEINGILRPYEIFIESKDPEHIMWVHTLTRVISALFRREEDVSFLVQELRSIFDPRGGYRTKSGDWKNSIVHEIGDVIEKHILGLQGKEIKSFPKEAIMCLKCNVEAVMNVEGCNTCLNCGDSKCS